ncbi:flagellar hook-basal body protein [Halobacillus kuroshimensis]|uniref:Flagellar hook-basal body protein n=1 Tax=Halobacillus kuroshimensis TaxID=302481 RepID=A0ABS3DUI0_9BACI|nr:MULTISPECIES: flagellar hook-basal body protein [Halobacillus]MBN8235018.1 flagellar hook-basal body protein [Halobacillus kuroshimensis]
MINRSMIQSAATMGQLQQKLDIIGNNMANSQTTGYKSTGADFSSLLVQQLNNQSNGQAEAGRLTPDGIRVGTGAKLGSKRVDISRGSLKETDRALDAALLEENQLFVLDVSDQSGGSETQFTRAGHFYLNPLGNNQAMLTNADGHAVLGEDGNPIMIEDTFDGISIADDGSLLVQRNGTQEVEGKLQVVEASRPHLLEAAGGSRFRIPEGSGEAGLIEELEAGNIKLQGGALEQSNVDIGAQMTEMMTAQRAYQLNAQSISTGDQMMGLVNQLRS